MQTDHDTPSGGDAADEDDIFSMDRLRADPEFAAEMKCYARRDRVLSALVAPLGKVPYIGRLLAGFWYCVLDEGVYAACKPRWGAVTFSFLNDGFSPTLWHTWRQLTDPSGPYSGIWMDGAPRDEADAKRKLAAYAAERARDADDGECQSD